MRANRKPPGPACGSYSRSRSHRARLQAYGRLQGGANFSSPHGPQTAWKFYLYLTFRGSPSPFPGRRGLVPWLWGACRRLTWRVSPLRPAEPARWARPLGPGKQPGAWKMPCPQRRRKWRRRSPFRVPQSLAWGLVRRLGVARCPGPLPACLPGTAPLASALSGFSRGTAGFCYMPAPRSVPAYLLRF